MINLNANFVLWLFFIVIKKNFSFPTLLFKNKK